MWELDCEEGWVPKNWCFWTVVLEKTLESPLDCREIQLVHSKGDHSWVFFGRNDAKAETHTLATSCEELTHWKRLWCWEGLGTGGKGMTEDEMAGWHHWLDGREFEWTPGVGDGQGGLVCCNSWGRKDSDTTERLNWTELREPACQCRKCKRRKFNPCVRKIPWRGKLQPALVFLPGEFHGERSLVGYSPWGHKE